MHNWLLVLLLLVLLLSGEVGRQSWHDAAPPPLPANHNCCIDGQHELA